MCDGHPDNCSKFSHPRTLNQALNLFSFTFQVNHAKTTADAVVFVYLAPEAPISQCNVGYDSVDDGRKCLVDIDVY